MLQKGTAWVIGAVVKPTFGEPTVWFTDSPLGVYSKTLLNVRATYPRLDSRGVYGVLYGQWTGRLEIIPVFFLYHSVKSSDTRGTPQYTFHGDQSTSLPGQLAMRNSSQQGAGYHYSAIHAALSPKCMKPLTHVTCRLPRSRKTQIHHPPEPYPLQSIYHGRRILLHEVHNQSVFSLFYSLPANRSTAHCEWYFGRPVKLLTFKKNSITHCVIVPANSTLQSSARCGASDVLIHTSSAHWSLGALYVKVQELIGGVYTVDESGGLNLDEATVPSECLVEPATITKLEPDLQSTTESGVKLDQRSEAAGVMPDTLQDVDITSSPPVSPDQALDTPASSIDRHVSTPPPRGTIPRPMPSSSVSPRLGIIPLSIPSRSASPHPGTIPLLTQSPTGAAGHDEPPVTNPITVSSRIPEAPLGQLNRGMVKEEVDRALARAVADLALLLSRTT